jgi:hypothetical protein
MLRRILPILLLILGLASSADAQLIGVDSAYSDKLFALGVHDTTNMKGPRDYSYGTFDDQDEAYFYFRQGPDVERTYPIKPGATLVVYGSKDKSIPSDSSRIFLNFFNEITGVTSRQYILGDSTNVITVPDTMYTSVTLSMVYQPTVGDIVSFKRFFVDALLLIQKFDPLSVRRSNDGRITSAYPNPFTIERGTTINFETKKYAELSLVVMDIAGREVNVIDIGPRPAGEQSVEVSVPNEGIFLAQLLVDGVPSGKMIKLTAQY